MLNEIRTSMKSPVKITARLARMVAPIACALIAARVAIAAGPTVSVDWTKAVRTVDPRAYGVNCPQCFDPNRTANRSFFLSASSDATGGGKPIVRLHGWGMVRRRPNQYNQGRLNSDGTWILFLMEVGAGGGT